MMPAKTIKTFLIGSIMVGLGACAIQDDLDRDRLTYWRPSSEQNFYYHAKTYVQHPPEDEKAERMRMRWLEDYLEANSMCADGYEILDRKIYELPGTFLGKQYRIEYEGRCLGPADSASS